MNKISVLLLNNIKNTGRENEVVDLKTSFATFLIKKGLAREFNPEVKLFLNKKKVKLNEENEIIRNKLKNLEIFLNNKTLHFCLKKNKKNGLVFGSININNIINKIKEEFDQNFDISPNNFNDFKPIKKEGFWRVNLLIMDKKMELKLLVESEF